MIVASDTCPSDHFSVGSPLTCNVHLLRFTSPMQSCTVRGTAQSCLADGGIATLRVPVSANDTPVYGCRARRQVQFRDGRRLHPVELLRHDAVLGDQFLEFVACHAFSPMRYSTIYDVRMRRLIFVNWASCPFYPPAPAFRRDRMDSRHLGGGTNWNAAILASATRQDTRH